MAGDVIVHLVKMWWLIRRICWSNDECFFFSRNVVTATPGLNPAFWGAAGLFFDRRKQRKV